MTDSNSHRSCFYALQTLECKQKLLKERNYPHTPIVTNGVCVDITKRLLEISLPSPFLPRSITLLAPKHPELSQNLERLSSRGCPEDSLAFPPCQDSGLEAHQLEQPLPKRVNCRGGISGMMRAFFTKATFLVVPSTLWKTLISLLERQSGS